MKNIYHIFIYVIVIFITFALVACEKIDSDDYTEESGNTNYQTVKIATRVAADSDNIAYPIRIRAVNNKGDVCGEQVIENANSSLSLKLPQGEYRITAISGKAEFTNGWQNEPMLIGHTDVKVTDAPIHCTIVLAYAVASIETTLSKLPDNVSAVNITLSPLYTCIDEGGEYGNIGNVTIPLQKETTGVWRAGPAYVLPGTGTLTTMTIAMTTSSGQETYSVTYQASLSAGIPYRFEGTFSGSLDTGYAVSGTFENAGWQDEVIGEFTFGPSGGNSFGGNTNITEFAVNTMPAQGSIWNGHIVALNTDGDALLLSREEWHDMTSAYHTETPNAASSVAEAYSEEGISEWSIPTKEEARSLKDAWSNSEFDILNRTLATAGYDTLSEVDDKGKNVRYLCEGARYTFTFSGTSGITAAGKTVTTYRLRLVKRVRFILN